MILAVVERGDVEGVGQWWIVWDWLWLTSALEEVC